MRLIDKLLNKYPNEYNTKGYDDAIQAYKDLKAQFLELLEKQLLETSLLSVQDALELMSMEIEKQPIEQQQILFNELLYEIDQNITDDRNLLLQLPKKWLGRKNMSKQSYDQCIANILHNKYQESQFLVPEWLKYRLQLTHTQNGESVAALISYLRGYILKQGVTGKFNKLYYQNAKGFMREAILYDIFSKWVAQNFKEVVVQHTGKLIVNQKQAPFDFALIFNHQNLLEKSSYAQTFNYETDNNIFTGQIKSTIAPWEKIFSNKGYGFDIGERTAMFLKLQKLNYNSDLKRALAIAKSRSLIQEILGTRELFQVTGASIYFTSDFIEQMRKKQYFITSFKNTHSFRWQYNISNRKD